MSTVAGEFIARAPLPAADTEKLRLTGAGEELRRDDPDVVDLFTLAAAGLARSGNAHKNGFEYIGGGNFAHVYGISDDDRYCVKVVSQNTIKDVWRNGGSMPVTNLYREVRFMDAIQRHLASCPASGVYAPRQFAALSFRGGMASLQERVPVGFKTLKALHNTEDESSDDEWEHASVAYERATKALAGSPLRLGVGDMLGVGGRINLGNFLLHHEMLSDGPVYIIDLIGRSKSRRALAAGAATLDAFSKRFTPKHIA